MRVAAAIPCRLEFRSVLSGADRWRLSNSERKRFHSIAHNACDACGERQQRFLVLAVARHGLAPCPPTKTNFDEAI